MDHRFGRLAVRAVLWIGLAVTAVARADENAGVITGIVVARSTEFILVRAPDDAPRRHWLKWIEAKNQVKNTVPDAAILATFNALVPGDEVTVQWTKDDRRRIESIKFLNHARPPASQPVATVSPATQPSAAPTPATPVAASTQSTAVAISANESTRSTVGEGVNASIDNALAFANRLLELPMSILLAVVAAGGAVLLSAAIRLEMRGRPAGARWLRYTFCVVTAIFLVFLIDRKISSIQNEIGALRTKVNMDGLERANTVHVASQPDRGYFFDLAAAQTALAANFKDVTLQPSIYNTAIDVVQVHFGDPLLQAYLAIVDLTNPAVTIKLGTGLEQKTLTSDFAKANDCTLAINGEAGQSPAMNSGFGVWRGNLVYAGQVFSRENPKIPKPFIGFDAKNHAMIRAAAAADRSIPVDAPTVIWGRLDSIIDGVVQTADERYAQPRTAIGVNQDGTKLYLLVIDGRQPHYSTGATRAEVGAILKAFGAYNAMLCDEGGSSCMYLQQLGGITNTPSDNNGMERPTYTHFGVSVKQ